jgi:hypothetical protein
MLQLNLCLAVKQICELIGSSSSKKATVLPATPALAAGPTFSDNRSESLLQPVLGPIDQVFVNHEVYPSFQPGTNSLDVLTPIHKTNRHLSCGPFGSRNSTGSNPPSRARQCKPRAYCVVLPSNFKGPALLLVTLSLRSNALITTITSFVPAVEPTISCLGKPA